MGTVRSVLADYARGLWHSVMLNGLAASSLVPVQLRSGLLRRLGLYTGRCRISAGVWIGGTDLAVGDGAFINTRCVIDTSAPVTIGRNVSLGPGVYILTSSHEIGPGHQRAGDLVASPVFVGDGAWIGARAIIMPGVKIADGAVIAAGAVVTRDCDPHWVYAGVPARPLREADG